MRKALVVFATGAVVALSAASPAAALCPAPETGEPGRSEFAKHHITMLAGNGLGQIHKPGEHRGASDCEELNP
jgi:hypothetical protein